MEKEDSKEFYKGIQNETRVCKNDNGVSLKFGHVNPSKKLLDNVQVKVELQKRVFGSGTLEAWSQNSNPLIDTGDDNHQFVAAVNLAFSEHYPLIITPDIIWIMIGQGFALHINSNSEQFKKTFNLPDEKVKINVVRNDFKKGENNPWLEVFGEFSSKIGQHVGEVQSTLVADFSTTTPISKAVSEITLMDAFQKYFDYEFYTMCGIPEIHLRGTQQDWEKVKQKALDLKKYELDWWIPSLIEVIDQFISMYQVKDQQQLTEEQCAFWCSIFKYKDSSGGPYVNGWINVLLPYLKNWDLNSPIKYTKNKATTYWQEGFYSDFSGGPNPDRITSGMSMALFTWSYLMTKYNMQFHGGFVGVSQDSKTLALEAELGWIVAEKKEES